MTEPERRGAPALADEVVARNRRLVRRSVLALVVAGSGCLVVGGVSQGASGLVGALIGVVLVVAFFGIDLVVLRATRYTPPIQVLAVVAMVYLFKITMLAVFLVALRGTEAFSIEAFGASVIVLTFVALVAATVLVARRQVPLIEPAPGPDLSAGSIGPSSLDR